MACECSFTSDIASFIEFTTDITSIEFASCSCDLVAPDATASYVTTDDGEYLTDDNGSLIVEG